MLNLDEKWLLYNINYALCVDFIKIFELFGDDHWNNESSEEILLMKPNFLSG